MSNQEAIIRGRTVAALTGIDTGYDSEITDHITDILLWADDEGHDVNEIIRMVWIHFEAES